MFNSLSEVSGCCSLFLHPLGNRLFPPGKWLPFLKRNLKSLAIRYREINYRGKTVMMMACCRVVWCPTLAVGPEPADSAFSAAAADAAAPLVSFGEGRPFCPMAAQWPGAAAAAEGVASAAVPEGSNNYIRECNSSMYCAQRRRGCRCPSQPPRHREPQVAHSTLHRPAGPPQAVCIAVLDSQLRRCPRWQQSG